jgi:site-specific recombinase XerD
MNREQFAVYTEQFLRYLREEKQRSNNTYRAYTGDLKQFDQFWQELETSAQTTDIMLKPAIEKFLSTLAQSPIDRSSLARKISCFNSFKKFLKKQHIHLDFIYKRPPIQLKSPEVVSVNQITYLLDQIPDDALPTKSPLRDKAILELLYATGVRVSELVQIELASISLINKSICIRSKRAKERIVFFGTPARDRLEAYLKHERKEPQNTHECLFLNCRNQPLTTRSIQRICAMFRKFLTHEQLTPCLLRHSFATHLLTQGAEIAVVQELLGHKTTISTQRYHKTVKS